MFHSSDSSIFLFARETFYSPAIGDIRAGGKLLSAATNLRVTLKKWGLVATGKQKTLTSSSPTSNYDTSAEVADIALQERELSKTIDVKLLWAQTYNIRRKFLSSEGLDRYMLRYPCLSNDELAIELVL